MANEDLYERATREWAVGVRDQALFAKCATKAKFNEKDALARYIEERVRQLRKQDAQEASYNRAVQREQNRQRQAEQAAIAKEMQAVNIRGQADAVRYQQEQQLWEWKRKTALQKSVYYIRGSLSAIFIVLLIVAGVAGMLDRFRSSDVSISQSTAGMPRTPAKQIAPKLPFSVQAPSLQVTTQGTVGGGSHPPHARLPVLSDTPAVNYSADDDSYAAALAAFEHRYPEINPDSPSFDQFRTDGIATRVNQYMDQGMTKTNALQAAIRDTYGR